MRRVLLLCFLCVWGSVARADETSRWVDILRSGRLPARPAADWYVDQGGNQVEIRGVLRTTGMPEWKRDFPPHYMAYLLTGLDGTVTIGGKMVTLDFGANPELRRLARALDGKRVLLHGRVESRRLPLDETREALRRVEYVVVTDIEDGGESLRETVDHPYVTEKGTDIEIGGWVFQARHLLFGRAATGITVAGQTYWLDFGSSDERFKAAGQAMVAHKFVRITGRLRGKDGRVEVTGLEVAPPEVQVTGILQEYPRPDCTPEFAIYPPMRTLQVSVNGAVYVLAFKDRALYCQAFEMIGSTVVLRGRLSGSTIEVLGVERGISLVPCSLT